MKKLTVLLVIVIALVIVASSAFYVVEENQYACTFRFSEIVNTVGESGLHFKIPFVDSVKYFPRQPCSTTFLPLRC